MPIKCTGCGQSFLTESALYGHQGGSTRHGTRVACGAREGVKDALKKFEQLVRRVTEMGEELLDASQSGTYKKENTDA